MPKTVFTATMALSRWRGNRNDHDRTKHEGDRMVMARSLQVLRRLAIQIVS
jgi:hypothetical protein